MADDPSDGYRVSCPLDLLQRLRLWAERAAALGLGEVFVSDLRAVQQHLATDPLEWGEPRYTLASGQTRIYQGANGLLHVTYGVHEMAWAVFIIDIGLMPNSPLAGDP